MPPKLCMALMFLTMVCLRPIRRPPLIRQALTTIGSSSGMRPTAADSANSSDASQWPFVRPVSRNTKGTSVAIKRTSTRAIEAEPWSKLCFVFCSSWR